MEGLSTSGSISLGCALVAGRKRVPSPAAGMTALRTFTMAIPPRLAVQNARFYSTLAALPLTRPGRAVSGSSHCGPADESTIGEQQMRADRAWFIMDW
jgi:hypothetical protein